MADRNKVTSDEQLLADHLAGKPGRFEALVERYSQELFHFLLRFLANRAAAEDLVQETFLQVHLSADSFDPERKFKPWLFTIAANKARDALRSKGRRPETSLDAGLGSEGENRFSFRDLLAGDVDLPEEALEAREQAELVRRIVGEMPDSLREVLILAYFHRFPYKDIAEMLAIPLGTVKSRLHTAVAAFGQAYKLAIDREKI
jgi:RNA polymerase sigma-70 factor (ECF subfamily)